MTSLTKSAHSLYCYVDESGEPGTHFANGKYFIVSLVMFENVSEIERCEKEVKDLRKVLGLSADFEFHYTHNSVKFRNSFIKMLGRFEFSFVTVAIDKTGRLATCQNIAKHLVENMPAADGKVSVLIDENPALLFELKRELCKKYKKYKCVQGRSHSHDLLQVADYITSISKNELLGPSGGSRGLYGAVVKKGCIRVIE